MNINFIMIKPYTQYSVLYYINNEKESHSKKIKDMEKLLIDILGLPFYTRIDELLYSFQYFFVDVENKNIIELEFDKEKELRILKESIKNEDLTHFSYKKETKLDKFHKLGKKFFLS